MPERKNTLDEGQCLMQASEMAAAGEGDGKNWLDPGARLSLCPVGRTPGFVKT